jgi:hypothetical protein
MEMVLLDWTRMGKTYCLAGVSREGNTFRIVRPLSVRNRDAAARNVGWSPWFLDGHGRWEVFELLGAEEATPDRPHLEDIWVQALRPCRRLATLAERQAILAATMASVNEPIFGEPLRTSYAAAHLEPGTGQRSLTTIAVSRKQMAFGVSQRQGVSEPDVRVRLPVPGAGERFLAVKDHHLLSKATETASSPPELIGALQSRVDRMGDPIAVRLGLSRPFSATTNGRNVCWLMADGFFSFNSPEP